MRTGRACPSTATREARRWGRFSKGIPNIDLVKGWDGGAHAVDRVRGGLTIRLRSPLLVFGLAAQPSVIKETSAHPQFRSTGLIARFIWSLPKSLVGHREIVPPAMSPAGDEAYQALVTKLLDVEPTVGTGGRVVPSVMALSDEAHGCFLGFRARLEPRLAEDGDLHRLQDWSGMSKPLMEDFYSWWLQLPENGFHGRQRRADTARKIGVVAQLMWEWAEDSDRWPEQIPRPRRIRMRRARPRRVRAPTWAEMERCIAAATGWQHQLLTVLRFTGLRVGETMLLTWDDIDLDRYELFIDAAISKNGEERTIPISPLLVDEFAGWGVRAGHLIPSPRAKGPRYRQPRARAWERAGVSERIWKQAPHHAFRKGFKSEMLRAGAPADAVDASSRVTSPGAGGAATSTWSAPSTGTRCSG